MTAALLALVALTVMMLPAVPALLEWHRPTDIEPLVIDTADGLEPAFLAHGFAARLKKALHDGGMRLGASTLVSLSAPAGTAPWPLSRDERTQRTSHRVWHLDGNAKLPSGMAFMAEVAASGDLATAVGGLHRALMATASLSIARGSTVLRWAHAIDIDVAPETYLAGRATADRTITVHERVRFTRLHAPTLRFVSSGDASAAAEVAAPNGVFPVGLTETVVWDRHAPRAFSESALDIDAHRAWRGDVVCCGRLRLGAGCHVRGSLKAHGELALLRGCAVTGSLVAAGTITLAEGCRVHGVVTSETAIVIGPGCIIGAPGELVTVCAPRIEVAPGAVVHGTLWAGDSGCSLDIAAATVVEAPAVAQDVPWLAAA